MKVILPVVVILAALVGVPLAVRQLGPRFSGLAGPAAAEASMPLPAWERYLRVPGTGVRMVTPDGFWLHPRRPGFQSDHHDASLLVSQLGESFAQVRRRLEPAAMASRGMAFQSCEPVRIDGVPGVLVKASQQRAGGRTYVKWIAAVGDDRRSVMLVATYPKARAGELAAAMTEALLTARFDDDARPQVMGGLPLRIEPVAGFTIARRTQTSALFTRDGQWPTRADDRARFFAGVERAGGEVIDRRAYAQARLAQLPGVRDLLIHTSNYASAAGLPAYEIVATATLNDRDQPCLIHQTLAFDGRTVYVLRGMGLYRNGQTCLDQFRAMTGSLRVQQPPTPER